MKLDTRLKRKSNKMDGFSYSNSTKYYIKNDKCYTEDRILVQELYLYNIPAELSEDEILRHFRSYGSVVRLELFDTCENTESSERKERSDIEVKQNMKTGRILFANAIDAAKVIQLEVHLVNGHQFGAKPSDSWLQPDAYGSLESEQSYVTKIPDDCLIQILEFLPLIDQLHFLRYCYRFRDVYHLDTRPLHKSVDFYILKSFKLWDIRDFFAIFGRYVENIKGRILLEIPLGRFFTLLGRNCVNLKSLEIFDTYLDPKNMEKIFKNTIKLENLILKKCDLTDSSLISVEKLKNLKMPTLSHNCKLSGLGLEKLPVSIEILDISFCDGILSSNLNAERKVFPNLKELNVVNIRSIHSDIFSNLTSIETLRFDIDNETNYERIAGLPNLKIVQIRCIASIDIFGKFLDQLVALKSQKLEQLHIHNASGLTNRMLMQIGTLSVLQKLIIWLAGAISNDILEELTNLKNLQYISIVDCQNISDSGVLQLILGCPKLRELKFMYCSRITEKLVHDIISNFERQIVNKENERHLPIHLYVGGTKIRESINTHLDSTSSNIIKICFVT